MTTMSFSSLLPLALMCLLVGVLGCVSPQCAAAEPDFGPNVQIFDPSMPDIQARVSAVFAAQESSQFGPNRHALLFKPGAYDLDIRVGFYTQVAGLGRSPDDVKITGALRATAEWMKGNATCNFWRCVENLSLAPKTNPNVWAVSQATWMRRVHIKGDLHLWDGGWSSGGFLADSRIDGTINSGSQQQWFSRNAQWGKWEGGNWNMVFVGVTNPPAGRRPAKPYTVIERTPIVREKPYIAFEEGKYVVVVPRVDHDGSRGTTWADAARKMDASVDVVSIDKFHVARADRDTAASINAALAEGKHLLLTPGIYKLDAAVNVTRAGTVVLGMGYASLAPTGTNSALTVADVDGVCIAGVLFEAGPKGCETLVRIGEKGATASHAKEPITLSDITCRAGGAQIGRTDCMLMINSNNVIVDNAWLWRADHGEGAAWDVNTNRNGLIVNGNDVTMYGLFVEHQQEYQTIWNGNGGRVYFYQSEMPYDPPSQEAWSHNGVRGYASYKVAATVKTHEAWGLGVYCVFRGAPVIADCAFEVPEVPGVKLHHMTTIRLSGLPESGIAHVINKRGAPVIHTQKATVD